MSPDEDVCRRSSKEDALSKRPSSCDRGRRALTARPIRLVCPNDKAGTRSARMLEAIDVVKLRNRSPREFFVSVALRVVADARRSTSHER